MRRLTILSVLFLAGVAKLPEAMSIAPVAFPFGHSTVTPYVVADGNGFDVSWVDGKMFNFAHFDGAKWSKANVIARGDMLQNRADYPSIAVSGRNMFAQWREQAGKGRNILLARSNEFRDNAMETRRVAFAEIWFDVFELRTDAVAVFERHFHEAEVFDVARNGRLRDFVALSFEKLREFFLRVHGARRDQ